MRKTVFIFLFNILPFTLSALTGWTDPLPLTNVSGGLQDFSFSVSADRGTGYFAYACSGGSANNGVYFKNSCENSLTWSFSAFLSAEGNDAVSPSVSGLNGFIYNAWLDNNSGIYRVFFKRGLNGENQELSGGGNCSSVNIFSGSSGEAHVVWTEGGSICYRKGFNSGSNWSAVKTLSTGISENPFAFETGGSVFVFWQAGGIAKYSKSSDGGLNWSGESSFSSTGIAALSGSAAIPGTIYAVWEQSNKIYFRKYSGSAWELEKTVSGNTTGTAKYPAVTADAGGVIYVVWSDNRTGLNKIYISESRDSGVTFSAETLLGPLALPGKILLASFKDNLHLLYPEAGQVLYRIKDTCAPSKVVVKAPAYQPCPGGSSNNCPEFTFEASDNEGGTGVKGFSYLLDKNPSTVPVEIINCSSPALAFTKIENGNWYLHVKAADALGNWGVVSHFNMVINNISLLPESEVWLAPNPVRTGQNPVLRIFIPEPANLELTVFNEAGEILTTVQRNLPSGISEIKEPDTSSWANGVYFYRLKVKSAGTGTAAKLLKKLLLLR